MQRRLGVPKLSGKPTPSDSATKLGGKITPYVPRGAQYDYNPPSVFARYKVLTTVFVILLVSLFGYWAIVWHPPRAAARPDAARPDAARPAPQVAPQSDPVYVEPLTPK